MIQGAEHSDDLLLSSPKILQGMLEFLRGEEVSEPIVAVPFTFRVPGD